METIIGIGIVILVNIIAISIAWEPSFKWIKNAYVLEVNTSEKHLKRRKKIILYRK